MMILPLNVLPEDERAGVRALIAVPSGTVATFCPADHLDRFAHRYPYGTLPAAYGLIDYGQIGAVREGETGNFSVRTPKHLSKSRKPQFRFSAAVWFSGPSITKEIAGGLQHTIGEALAQNGRRASAPPPAHRPNIFWPPVEEEFDLIRALTQALGFDFLPPPPDIVVDAPLNFEEIYRYAGPYQGVAASIDGEIVLLERSEIRRHAAPSARKIHAELRDKLVTEKLLVAGPPGALVTLRPLRFPSLDAAAKFVRGNLGGSHRDWAPWRLPEL
jgi:hypothetical protein